MLLLRMVRLSTRVSLSLRSYISTIASKHMTGSFVTAISCCTLYISFFSGTWHRSELMTGEKLPTSFPTLPISDFAVPESGSGQRSPFIASCNKQVLLSCSHRCQKWLCSLRMNLICSNRREQPYTDNCPSWIKELFSKSLPNLTWRNPPHCMLLYNPMTIFCCKVH